MEEKIISVKGIEYIVSEDGRIYGTHTCGRGKYHQEICQRKNQDGYMFVTVGVKEQRSAMAVHRMVAMAFIPNPDSLPEVNHKDFDRTNNNVDNLEWCTHEDNIRYTINAGRHISSLKDVSGKNNPNYGNHKLREKYRKDPELSKHCQSRPGDRNGRAVQVYLFNYEKQCIAKFPYLQLCAKYVCKELGLKESTSASLAGRIPQYVKTGRIYRKTFYFSYDNTVLSSESNGESATTTESIS